MRLIFLQPACSVLLASIGITTGSPAQSSVGASAAYDRTDRKLGEGGFSTVIMAVDHATGHQVAVKIPKQSTMCEEEIRNEIEIMQHLQSRGGHPNVVKLISSQREPYSITMEYCDEQHLGLYFNSHYFGQAVGKDSTFLGPNVFFPDEYRTRMIFQDVSAGLHFLHENGVAHLDLKPENILSKYDDYQQRLSFKIADFGDSDFTDRRSSVDQVRG